MARPIPPPKVLPPGSNRDEVRAALAREVTRIHGQSIDDLAAYEPAHVQFMLDQAEDYIQALLNLGILKRAG